MSEVPRITTKKLLRASIAKEIGLGGRLTSLYIRRGRKWTMGLTVFLMAIAFVNLIFMASLLNGIVSGTERQVRDNSSGEIYLTPNLTNKTIAEPDKIIEQLKTIPGVDHLASSLTFYGELKHDDYDVATQIRVIDADQSRQILNLAQAMQTGEYLSEDDEAAVVLGSELIAPANERQIPKSLEKSQVGDRIKLKINGLAFDVTIKGVFRTKYIEADRSVVMSRKTWEGIVDKLEKDFAKNRQEIVAKASLPSNLTAILPSQVNQELTQRADDQAESLLKEQEKVFALFPGKNDVNLITIRTAPTKITQVKQAIADLNLPNITVHSWREAAGFMTSVSNSFIGINAIMLVVGIVIAGVTIFIVIYVDVINKRRQIGIQRAIGVKPRIIVFSYVLLSIFYAICGVALGLIIFYAILVPYFAAHPFSLPVTDASLDLEINQLLFRAGIVMAVTITSGLAPAIMATRVKMLDAILGRN